MSQTSYFFNSRGDKLQTYSAEDFAAYFANMLTNGVIKHKSADALKVSYTSGYDVSVNPGGAVINGYQFMCDNENLSALPLNQNVTRYDRVVLRLDLNDNVNAISMYIKSGSDSAPPSLTREENIYEMSLAKLKVTVGNVEVVDERDDTDVCGVCKFIVETPMHDGIVFGTYVGNGAARRTINIGFTPAAVNVYTANGMQSGIGGAIYHYGGLAIRDNLSTAVEIVNNGFAVRYEPSDRIETNASDKKYYFIAYRNFEIMEVE